MYQLYPPIFYVPEESSFSDSWEVFCCKMLNIENKTSEIIRRLPPESGVDLFFPSKKIAYQCKSIETGLTNGFNPTLVKKSYLSALDIQSTLKWEKYILCINHDLTGNQQANLRKELPEVEILSKAYWLSLCKKYPLLARENFRKIIPIPHNLVEKRIQSGFVSNYSEKLKDLLQKNAFELIFYSNRHNSVYQIPVSGEFEVDDLVRILTGIFDLPNANHFSNGINVGLSYSIVHNDVKIPLNQSIAKAGIGPGSLITLWLTIFYSNGLQRASATEMQMITSGLQTMPSDEIVYAIALYNKMISARFHEVDTFLCTCK